MENISAVLEALILASEAPITLEKICAALDGVEKADVKDALDQLIADYAQRPSGISVQEVAGGYQFRTRPEMAAWVKKLKGTKPATLSPAALETLAIVAYRQPIVKSDIESIRGVDVGAPLKTLLDKKLIRIVGRMDVPGKPMIYGTTKKFLEVFNLNELSDLPTMRELKELTEHQEILEQETLDFDPSQSEVYEELRQESGEEIPREAGQAPPPVVPEEESPETNREIPLESRLEEDHREANLDLPDDAVPERLPDTQTEPSVEPESYENDRLEDEPVS